MAPRLIRVVMAAGPVFFDGFAYHRPQPGPQALFDQVDDIHGGFTAGNRQIVLGGPVGVEQLLAAVHNDRRGSETIHQDLLGREDEVVLTRRNGWRDPTHPGGFADRQFQGHPPAHADPTVDPPFFKNRLEQLLMTAHGFGVAQEQKPAVAQGEMKQGDDLALDIAAQIDQKIAATDQIKPGKRRITGEVLRCENHPFSYRLGHPDLSVLIDEEFFPSLR